MIQIYDEDFDIEHELVLDVKERPITDSDMDYHFPEKSRIEKRERRELIEDIKPPFTRVLIDNQNQFWLETDETDEGREIVVLDYEGNPLGRVLIPSNNHLHDIRNNKIYLANNALEQVEVYSVDL